MSKLSLPASMTSNKGLTLVEVLVALAVSGLILTLVLGLTNSSRALYNADQVRTELNQNLRSGMDLIGTDLRIAGQGIIGSPISAIRLQNNELTIITRSSDAILPPLRVCQNIQGGRQTVSVFQNSTNNQGGGGGGGAGGGGGGNPFPPECRNNESQVNSALDEWRAYREANGGSVGVLIFDNNGQEEIFPYTAEQPSQKHIQKDSGYTWQNSYDRDDETYIMIGIEKRTYRLEIPDGADTGRLQLIRNGDTDNPVDLINNVSSFSALVIDDEGNPLTDFNDPNWQREMRNVEITLVGEVDGRTRTLASTFFPRNIQSR